MRIKQAAGDEVVVVGSLRQYNSINIYLDINFSQLFIKPRRLYSVCSEEAISGRIICTACHSIDGGRWGKATYLYRRKENIVRMNRDSIEEQIADYVIQYKDRHYRLAYSYVRNVEEALDIVQESISKAFSSKNSLKTPSYIKTWFYRIVVNTSLDFLRMKKKILLVGDDALSGYDPGVMDHYEDLDVKNALDELPEPYHTVITLRYFEDLKIEEVAEVMDENVNTVKTHLYKGLKKLRITMDDGYYEEGKNNEKQGFK